MKRFIIPCFSLRYNRDFLSSPAKFNKKTIGSFESGRYKIHYSWKSLKSVDWHVLCPVGYITINSCIYCTNRMDVIKSIFNFFSRHHHLVLNFDIAFSQFDSQPVSLLHWPPAIGYRIKLIKRLRPFYDNEKDKYFLLSIYS